MQSPEKRSFGEMLRFFRGQTIDRHNGKSLSQEMLAFRVSETIGLNISRNTVNNWENSKSYLQSEHDRPLLIAIVAVLHKYRGIKTLEDATQLLESGGFKTLDAKEATSINPEWVQRDGLLAEKGQNQKSSDSTHADQIPSIIPPITINIGSPEPIPVIIHTPQSARRGNPVAQVGDFLVNLLARVFFAILEVAPDWLTNWFSSSHVQDDQAAKKEINLIDPECGNQALDLKQQRLKVSAAFGSYFTGLLEKEHSYFPIHGQVDLSLPSTSSHLESFQQIYWSLQYARGPEFILIAAEGGMGKSTLAAKIIRCLYSDNAVDLLLGDSAKSHIVNPLTGEVIEQTAEYDDLDSFLFKVSSQLGLEYSLGESNRQLAIRKIKDRLEGRRTILVMDNLESVRDGTELLNTFRSLTGRDTRLLVTTRRISGISSQTSGIFLIHLNPIQEERTGRDFLRWHIMTNAHAHQDLNRLLPELDDRDNIRRLIDKTGGIPLLMQLVLSDIARSTWARLAHLPSLFGKELLNYLYQERWVDLGEMGQPGQDARALLFHLSEQSHRGPITYAQLLAWSKTTRGLDSADELLRIVQERFLIVNNDLKHGNFSIFPSLNEFLQTRKFPEAS